jgi:hypothetical protein
MTPEHTIAALCQRSRDISLEKGWLNPDGTDPRPFHTVIGLFHTELSEAFEDIRNNKVINEIYYEHTYDPSGGGKQVFTSDAYARLSPTTPWKPCGFPVELADFVIRVCQYYGSAGRGDELERGMGVEHALRPHNDVPDDAEALITGLHASTSMAFIAFSFALAGNKVDLPAIGFPSEPLPYLASALLSLFDFCKKKDINIWAAIDEKEAYNRTRPQKHGGKKM